MSLTIASLTRGTYYIAITKSGKVSSDGGYSSYGSVGQYVVSGQFNEMNIIDRTEQDNLIFHIQITDT